MQNVKLFVATPMYGGLCTGFYMQSMLVLQDAVKQRGWNFVASFMYNESLIQRARNSMAKAFLKTDCTHMLFIDADIRFDPGHILTMVDADKDVIAGIYPKKEINWWSVEQAMKRGVSHDRLKNFTGSFVVNLLNGNTTVTVPQNEPLEVLNAGTGCMLIKRHVFEDLISVVPAYSNDVTDLSGTMENAEKIYEFFGVSICPDSNRLLSEDYDFCQKWRRFGGQIFVAPWTQLAHVGSYVFEGGLIPEEQTVSSTNT